MCADFLPLIDSSSKKMREDLQSLERGLDSVITIQKEQFSEVFQFVQEAALLWTNQQNAIEQMHKKYEVQEAPSCRFQCASSFIFYRKVWRNLVFNTTKAIRTWKPILMWCWTDLDRDTMKRLVFLWIRSWTTS